MNKQTFTVSFEGDTLKNIKMLAHIAETGVQQWLVAAVAAVANGVANPIRKSIKDDYQSFCKVGKVSTDEEII